MSTFVERPRTTCALGGAIATIGALPRVVALTHSAIGCGGNLSGTIATCGGNLGEGYSSGSHIPSSAVGEREIVFGGAERLEEEIRTAQEVMDADLFVVATGCMTEMIGDDVQGVVREFEDAKIPVIAVSTPSFKGDAYAGYEIVLEGIFNRFLPTGEEREKDPKLVNLFGVVPAFDPFFRGDLEEIQRLLETLGLKVNTFFTPDQTFDNILSAPKAALNIQLSRVWGTEFVKHFEQRHGTPYWITDLPIGGTATEAILRELEQHIRLPKGKVNKLIERENLRYYDYFVRGADIIANSQFYYYAATVTNSNYAIPLASFLSRELGWHVQEIFDTDLLKDNRKEQFAAAFAQADLEGELIFEPSTQAIGRTIARRHPRNQGQRYFDGDTPFYLVGSNLEKYAAQELGASTLAVSYPLQNRVIADRGYAGYNGGLRLFEDLISVLVAGK